MNKTQLAELIAIAKTNDGRTQNRGRPKVGLPENERIIASEMRKQKCSISGIFRAMKEKGLTRYKTQAAFRQAWNNR